MAKKRRSEGSSRDTNENQAKKEKKMKKEEIWTEEDEIAILQGMINFKAERGNNRIDESSDDLYEFIKKSLSFEVSKNQFLNKINSMKKKFLDLKEKKILESVKKPDWFENSFIARTIAGFGVDEHYVKERWSLVSVENKKKLEDKYVALQLKELKIKSDLLQEATLLIVEASKKKL